MSIDSKAFRKINWPRSLVAASIAASGFIICALLYIIKDDFVYSWVLYLGSLFFFFVIAFFTVFESRKRGGNESTVALVFAAHVTILLGIIISVIGTLLLLFIFSPGFIISGAEIKHLQDAPPAAMKGKTGGLVFKLFFAAVVLNFFGGSIAGFTLPFYTKFNQTKDNREPTPLKQHEPG